MKRADLPRARRPARDEAVRGDPAESLHSSAGWQRVGVIPDYAPYPDGRPCDTVVFYKTV